ncbi:MAG TPA: ABC transporter substrate-binding protein [Pseudolabrys sp.]|nr:ABC transporter substrate-binding protein [Pseudolabrys sp.]
MLKRRDVLALTGVSALAAVLPRGALAQGAAAPLNFGYQNTSWGTIGMVAEAQDLFKKAGGNVTVYRFDGGKAARDAMISGRLDIGVLGSTPFVVGAAKGDMVAIGISMYAGSSDSIVAAKNKGIKTIADLKGRKVASQIGSATDHVFQDKILPKFGLTRNDVHVVNIPHQNHIAALASGSVDAFAGVEPFPTLAEVDGLGEVLVDYSQFDILPVILTANRPVIEGKRDAVIAFLRGWLAAVKLYKDDQAKAAKIVFDHFNAMGFTVSEAVIKRMLPKLDVNPQFIPALKGYLDAEAQQLIKQHAITAVPDWDKLLNTELMHEAMKA